MNGKFAKTYWVDGLDPRPRRWIDFASMVPQNAASAFEVKREHGEALEKSADPVAAPATVSG